MLRRLATSLAATSALVLTATVPAFANHADPFESFDADDVQGGNLKTCDGLVEDVLTEAGYEAEFFWQKSMDVYSTDDVIDHQWWDVTISEDLKRLTVDGHSVPDGDFLVVLVKGGPATNMFVGPELEDLFAPVNASGDHAKISNYTICKFKGEKKDEEETPEPTPTPTSTQTTTPEPEPTEPEGMGGGEPTKTPAPVPTAVPAGIGEAGGSSMAPVGFAAAALMLIAGGATLVRRRFAQQS